ncbi:hypothetical protein C7S20_10700 [Christiangramia fulva]|uniref:Four helix bundle protein n=1 Tax=Christiangramia fulva TaxID=2126553 RepID=A0A2R3Z5Y6_9FLAO|nr:hypothetical protein [Christiangramia fulva]AVR45686.1 hypothetical protein C7S20_10700 [Christiangramia fulva]
MNYFSGHGAGRRSAFYFKAQEIRQLSRRISEYLIPDLSGLSENGSENKYIYYTGDIIRHTESLLSNISKAEDESIEESKMKYVSSVNSLTDRLYKNCENLEKVNSNGRDFLRILRHELNKFRKLHRVWKLSL